MQGQINHLWWRWENSQTGMTTIEWSRNNDNENENGNRNGDIITRLIKEASGLEGEITECKITLSTESGLKINFRNLLKLKHETRRK